MKQKLKQSDTAEAESDGRSDERLSAARGRRSNCSNVARYRAVGF